MKVKYGISDNGAAVQPVAESEKNGNGIPTYRVNEENPILLIRDVTDDSESDCVDVTEMKKMKTSEVTSQREEASITNHLLSSNNATGIRSSMKKPNRLEVSEVDESDKGSRRTISFNINGEDSSSKDTLDDAQKPNEANENSLFMTSRWSTSSSETSTPQRQKIPKLQALNDVSPINDITDRKSDGNMSSLKKSQSLKPKMNNRVKLEGQVKRRHSVDGKIVSHSRSLRDSAIDLVSDDENSEVYTAVSLAGTLSRNANPVTSTRKKWKYVIIGASFGLVVIAGIVVALLVLFLVKP